MLEVPTPNSDPTGEAYAFEKNVTANLGEAGTAAPFLIHDRDTKFSGPFDEVFRSEGTRVILTPIRAPNADAYAERWVGTVRSECLDRTLIQGRRHLERVLRTYVDHYDGHRCRPSNKPEKRNSPTAMSSRSDELTLLAGACPTRDPPRCYSTHRETVSE
jgi:putative transposase